MGNERTGEAGSEIEESVSEILLEGA